MCGGQRDPSPSTSWQLPSVAQSPLEGTETCSIPGEKGLGALGAASIRVPRLTPNAGRFRHRAPHHGAHWPGLLPWPWAMGAPASLPAHGSHAPSQPPVLTILPTARTLALLVPPSAILSLLQPHSCQGQAHLHQKALLDCSSQSALRAARSSTSHPVTFTFQINNRSPLV